MRILLTTRGSSGHVLPLAPFGHACVAPATRCSSRRSASAHDVDRDGLPVAPVADPPPEQLDAADGASSRALRDRRGQRPDDRRLLRGHRHARRAAGTARDRRGAGARTSSCARAGSSPRRSSPSCYDIPIVRVGLGLRVDRGARRRASPRRRSTRPAGARPARRPRRRAPARRAVPDDDARGARGRLPRRCRRARTASPSRRRRQAAPLPDWWPGNDDPLVYVTLGSVAGRRAPALLPGDLPQAPRRSSRRCRAASC